VDIGAQRQARASPVRRTLMRSCCEHFASVRIRFAILPVQRRRQLSRVCIACLRIWAGRKCEHDLVVSVAGLVGVGVRSWTLHLGAHGFWPSTQLHKPVFPAVIQCYISLLQVSSGWQACEPRAQSCRS
jgi:hypothetical protein